MGTVLAKPARQESIDQYAQSIISARGIAGPPYLHLTRLRHLGLLLPETRPTPSLAKE
jgi:hypothetical protein